MATIKYKLRGTKTNKKTIWVFVSISRDKQYKFTTGLKIDPKQWRGSNNLPKQTTATNKNITTTLKKLEVIITEAIAKAQIKSLRIDKEYIQNSIDIFHGKKENKDTELLTYWINYIILNANTRPNHKGGIGIGKERIQKYKNLLKVVENWQGSKKYRLIDLDRTVLDNFKTYLVSKKYADSTLNKFIVDLKSVCKEAKKHSEQINTEIENYKPQQIKTYQTDTDIIYITPNELETIEETILEPPHFENARRLLLIACYTGQRFSDLGKVLNPKNIRKTKDGKTRIEFTQTKGNKRIIIPTTAKLLKLLEQPPIIITSQKLNVNIKKACELIGIETPVLGSKSETINGISRGVKKERPKYHYITTHVGRRTFATNLYGKVSNRTIMAVTGHSKEETFLLYLNKGKETEHHLKELENLEV